MISCERTSILFSRAQRPLTTTANNTTINTSGSSSSSSSSTTTTTTTVGVTSCLFSAHTAAASFCFSRGEKFHAGSGNANANGSCNNNNHDNNGVICTSSTMATGGVTASHVVVPSRPWEGDGGGKAYNTGGNHATNFTCVGTATTTTTTMVTVENNMEGDMANTGTMGKEENNNNNNNNKEEEEADDEAGIKQTASSNDEPTPETCTDTTPRTVMEEAFVQPQQQQQQQEQEEQEEAEEEEQQQQQEQEERDVLQKQQEQGCTFSQETPPLSCHSCEDACNSTMSNENGKDINVTGTNDEVNGCETSMFPSVVMMTSARKPLQSQIDLITARMGVTLFLENLSEDNKAEPVLTSDFHSHRLPQMPIEAYVDRVVRHSGVSGETLIASLMLLLKYSYFINHPVSVYNVHRLTITSLLLGAKLRDDQYYSNEYYSRIGGISNTEINKLELRFCGCLEWDMWLDESEYEILEKLLIQLVMVFMSNSEEMDDITRRKCQRQFWIHEIRPWKERFDISSSQRREYIRQCIREDFAREQAKMQSLNPHGSCFLQNPFMYSGINISEVSQDQVILPAVYRQTTNGTIYNNPHNNNNNTNNNNTTTSLVTVVAQNTNGSTTSIPSHYYHAYHPIYQQQQPRHQKQYGCGMYETNNNNNNNNNNVGGFGIMERALPVSPTTPTTPTAATTTTGGGGGMYSSGISIHAKPYYYKSRGNSSKKMFHKPHRYHYASSQQMDSCHTGDIAMMDTTTTTTTATYGSSSSSSSSKQNNIHHHHHNNNNNNNNEMEFASITSTIWRPSGTNNNNNNNNSSSSSRGRRPATSDSVMMERHSGGSGSGSGGNNAMRGSGPLVFPHSRSHARMPPMTRLLNGVIGGNGLSRIITGTTAKEHLSPFPSPFPLSLSPSLPSFFFFFLLGGEGREMPPNRRKGK
ncbi:CYC2-like cyclin 4, putative [Trypanosoma cruzi marinkellei]|uniref:CYC2-like cyclin 4, putative n=1 Tax=Trypanosoma cruzi marinkellei TaxID=85056 RepID=K2NI26_TRYCR|nr:CYC2-like cyclin 4, putative [Trypanosoma cruzi marinkellei]